MVSLGASLWTLLIYRIADQRFINCNLGTGPSMLPTHQVEGQCFITFRWPLYRLFERCKDAIDWSEARRREVLRNENRYARTAGRPIELGDLVYALNPIADKQVTKRVLGLPGDTILLDPRAIPLRKSAWQTSTKKANAKAGRTDAGRSKVGRSILDALNIDSDEDGDAPTVDPDGVIGSLRTEAQYVTVPKGHVFLGGDNLACSTDSREYGPVPLALVKGKIVKTFVPGTYVDWFIEKVFPEF